MVAKRREVETDIDSWFQPSFKSIPESRLAAAVLERAISDLFVPETHVRREAKKWFNKRYEEDEPFSFQWVSELLSMDPDILRHQVFKLAFFKYHARTSSVKSSNE